VESSVVVGDRERRTNATLAPTVNSYKRLVRRGAMSYYSWAPVFNSFGSNNRTNSIRVPMGGGRAEFRNADSSCNPYLAAAMLPVGD
jgi:glutamine synthetase